MSEWPLAVLWVYRGVFALVMVGGVLAFRLRHRGQYRAVLGAWAFGLYLVAGAQFWVREAPGAPDSLIGVWNLSHLALVVTAPVLLAFAFLRWDAPAPSRETMGGLAVAWCVALLVAYLAHLVIHLYVLARIAPIVAGAVAAKRHFRGIVAVTAAVAGLSLLALDFASAMLPSVGMWWEWVATKAPAGVLQSTNPMEGMVLAHVLGLACLVVAIWASGDDRGGRDW